MSVKEALGRGKLLKKMLKKMLKICFESKNILFLFDFSCSVDNEII